MRLDRDLENVDLYAVLGVPRSATTLEIRRKYRRLVSISHPDLNPHDMRGAERRMARINVAAGILIDPARRAAYDRIRAGAGRRRSPRAGHGRRHAPTVDISHVRLDARDLEILEHLRSWPARAMASFEHWTEGWTPEFRMAFLCASMAIAVGLIRLARPTSLPSPFEEARPAATAKATVARG